MTRIALRQYRTELVFVGVLLTGLAFYLVPTGLDNASTFEDSGLKACLAGGNDCVDLRFRLGRHYSGSDRILAWFHFIPGVVGVMLAAPIVSEFERRTYRLAWTQSITRSRWLLVELAVGVAAVLAFAFVFTALITWWYYPLDQSETLVGKDVGRSFSFEGVAPFYYTLFAFATAVAAGAITRKLVVAMPVALGAYVVVRLALEATFRGLSSEVSFMAVEGQLSPMEHTRDMERFWTVQGYEGLIFGMSSLVLFAVTFWIVRQRS